MEILDPRQTIEYVPVVDREKPESERTVFLLRPLSGLEVVEIQRQFLDAMTIPETPITEEDLGELLDGNGEAEIRKKGMTREDAMRWFGLSVEAACKAVKGWRNLRSKDGEIPYSEAIKKALPAPVMSEIGGYVMQRNILNKEEEGNSESLSA